jgi:hypothetical protein
MFLKEIQAGLQGGTSEGNALNTGALEGCQARGVSLI